ncbi:Na/Pi cotransporter family protein [Roseomonas sp. SSH11]|uniref:Na/Pi cotransporter family protein n=1 Tax=Pararoseomonas baculiformis TaxID=2820812 RepID=A0ABS4ACU7_9PROT|nr:Na/Pi cotransporter family protein [Pararoseomonas baculiformis]MBP0444686.1 Na/Pi cotransporter family protein [Pararoseomonas baculiformis]
MDAILLLLELAGEAALLLFGLHLVQRGVDRGFGAQLRRVVAVTLGSPLRAFFAGLGITAALQSSTAAALMVGGLAARGTLGLEPALAAMLGANIGTALIVQLLSFDVRAVFPALILLGWVAYRRPFTRQREAGRAMMGLGLMLAALHLMLESMAPLQASPAFREVLHLLDGAPALNLIAAALLAWAMHSSVAAVLLVGSLAGAGVLGPQAAVAMVVGANLGSAITPVLAARGDAQDLSRQRMPIGNLANRIAGAALAMALLGPFTDALRAIDPSPVRLVANAHLSFNLVLALATLPFLAPFGRLLTRLLPAPPAAADAAAPRYLDPEAVSTPAVALSNATREVLRIADEVEAMLRDAAAALRGGDPDRARATARRDDVVDGLHRAVHAYLATLPRETLADPEVARLEQIRDVTIILEHVGDMVERGLARHASRAARRGTALPPALAEELAALHSRAIAQLRLALAVFIGQDLGAARQLVLEKEAWRQAERAAAARLGRSADEASAATARLALDVTRDLKGIAGHLAGIAHPLLEREGMLRVSRLRATPAA